MNEFLAKLKAVMEALGFTKKVSELTDEEKIQFAQKYKELNNSDLDTDLAAYNADVEKNKKVTEAIDNLPDFTASSGEGSQGTGGAGADDKAAKLEAVNQKLKELQSSNENKDAEIKKLQKEKEALEAQVESDDPKTVTMKISPSGTTHSDKHIFGYQHDMFARNKRWNAIMVDRALSLSGVNEDEVFAAFMKETREFGHRVAGRMMDLHQTNGLADVEKLGADVDYTGLDGAGLGEQFVVRRVDALIARIQKLPNVYDIFPRRTGVEDRDLITNAFFGEFSQPHQEGEVYKGDVSLEPEMGYVDDAMMKTLFKSWKWIERQYIGYLNKSGSDPIKWNMIEWAVLNIATVLTNEQYKRRIVGIFRKPVAGRPGHANHSSTGYIFTLIRYVHENKLLPISGAAFDDYTNVGTEMIDTVEAMVERVSELYEGDVEELVVKLNKNHKPWYKSGYRQKYSADGDFASVVDNKLQDRDVKIVWVPNMGNHKFIEMSKAGNFQCLENLPGEMLKIKFDEKMESVQAWSIWKEGFSASFVGRQFASPEALAANAYKLQEVFINKPVHTLGDGATTLDAANGIWQVTSDNGAATNITDISNAKEGEAYIIECGGLAEASTVNKAGKFDTIKSAYTPTKLGDYLMVVYDATDDKFYELERTIGGTRSINKDLQPNAPGNGGR
ncbi:hypothetical protein [Carboxylicivirga marina]|uniref:hypothetical protein n=1 Tax=Carboxylicivirga marina TaxID=2800988 RepID=UPI002594F4F5|nr:hypothetical protein [uncultured Carboxylicivirga sp.]